MEVEDCPVLKIDLGGRFVYVDEAVEALLGQRRENLFGRNIKEFLDERSYGIIKSILDKGIYYETSYSAARVTFIDSKGGSYQSSVIIWLNFIAGNPANYQILIDPTYSNLQTVSESRPDEIPTESLFGFVGQQKGGVDWQGLAELLVKPQSVMRAAVYIYHENQLFLMSQGLNSADESAAYDFTLWDENHLEVALSKKPCRIMASSGSYKRQESEDGRFSEVVFPLVCNNDCWGIVRFVINPDYRGDELELTQMAAFIGNALYSFVKGSCLDGVLAST